MFEGGAPENRGPSLGSFDFANILDAKQVAFSLYVADLKILRYNSPYP